MSSTIQYIENMIASGYEGIIYLPKGYELFEAMYPEIVFHFESKENV